MVAVKTDAFKVASQRALHDARIQAALARFGPFDEARQRAIQELGPERWQELRERAHQIKRHTVQHLDYYLDLFAQRAAQNGTVVHFARDVAEANSVVVELVRRHGVRLVTKGKSMVSEEMGINHLLEDLGVEVVETDLGEFIIQLAREAPFHIIAPAVHKSREQVADLFQEHGVTSRRLGRIEDLCAAARERLRDKFLHADMGMTGVNFAVAETGTFMVVTNEGNGRMCTSTPRIHVATMGLEKLVPSLEDLAVFLRLLPRAATGQRISSYMTFVNGPRRPSDEDGPDEVHVIILDNGRTRLLEDEALHQALYCVRCGACLNVCPVYRKVGGHAYGWVYPGPIGSIWTPVQVGLPRARDLPHASSLCGACHEACPVKINIPHMLLHLRRRLAEGGPQDRKAPLGERLMARAFVAVMRSHRRLALGRALAAFFQRLLAEDGRISSVPFPPFNRWTRERDMPALAPRSFHQVWDEELAER